MRVWKGFVALAVMAGAAGLGAASASAAPCSGSTSTTIRGKAVDLDQCVRSTVTRGSTNYTITVYYTETDTATNLAQCTAADAPGRCEHALSNNDDANGDNVNAALMATEAATALGF